MTDRLRYNTLDVGKRVVAAFALGLSSCVPAPREMKVVNCLSGQRTGAFTIPLSEGESVRIGDLQGDPVFSRAGDDLVVTEADQVKSIDKNAVVVNEPSTTITATFSQDKELMVKVTCN